MSEKIKRDYGDQGNQIDIDAVFDRTIGMVRDDTQRTIETPTELDEVGATVRERSLRQLGENAVYLLEQRRSQYEQRCSQFEKKGGFWARLFRR